MHVATPVDWKVGDDCMVLTGVKQEEAIEMFPKGLKTHEVPSGKVNLNGLEINTLQKYNFRNIFAQHHIQSI